MRSACFLGVLAAACTQAEVPHNAPAQNAATLEHRTAPAPPIAPRVWRVQLLTSGGFAGNGRGGISLDSIGEAPDLTTGTPSATSNANDKSKNVFNTRCADMIR